MSCPDSRKDVDEILKVCMRQDCISPNDNICKKLLFWSQIHLQYFLVLTLADFVYLILQQYGLYHVFNLLEVHSNHRFMLHGWKLRPSYNPSTANSGMCHYHSAYSFLGRVRMLISLTKGYIAHYSVPTLESPIPHCIIVI